MRFLYYTIWLLFPKLKICFGLDNLNPFTGFGLLDTGLEHASAKDLQQRGADIDREMFDKSTAHDIAMFEKESKLAKEQMKSQYDYNLKAVEQNPQRLMAGFKQAGLNPILAATGGFKSSAPHVAALGASAKSNSPSRGSGGQRANSNIAMAHKMGSLVESQADLNSAKAEAERARAGITGTKDALLQFANQVLTLASEALKSFRESGKFGKTDSNVNSIIENIQMLLSPSNNIELTEHTKRRLKKMENKLKSYTGKTGGRNVRNK